MLLIARREYMEQIRGRAFRISDRLLTSSFAVIVGIGYLTSHRSVANRHLWLLLPILPCQCRTFASSS